jgi:hypothetical protein
MSRKTILILLAFIGLLVALLLSNAVTSAQSGGVYDLTWNSIGGGGISSAAGGAYTISGKIGQPNAGSATGGVYGMNGGFWLNYLDQQFYLERYLPFIRR